MFMQVYHVKEMEQKIEVYSMERPGTLETTMLNPWLMLKREDVIVQGISTMKLKTFYFVLEHKGKPHFQH